MMYRNRLLIWAWLALCILIAVLLWARTQPSSARADLGLLFRCLAPDTERYLLLIPKDTLSWIPGNLRRLCGDDCLHSRPCRFWWKQDVIQYCAKFSLFVYFLLLSIFHVSGRQISFSKWLETAVEVVVPVILMVRFRHPSSYFKQIRQNTAIRQERMHENAAPLSILNNNFVAGSTSEVELHVHHSGSVFQHAAREPNLVFQGFHRVILSEYSSCLFWDNSVRFVRMGRFRSIRPSPATACSKQIKNWGKFRGGIIFGQVLEERQEPLPTQRVRAGRAMGKTPPR